MGTLSKLLYWIIKELDVKLSKQYAIAYCLDPNEILSVYYAMVEVVNKIALYLHVSIVKDISDVCCDEGNVIYKEALPFVRNKLLMLQGVDESSIDISECVELVQNCIVRMLVTGKFDYLNLPFRFKNGIPIMYVDSIDIKGRFLYINIGITTTPQMREYIDKKKLTRKDQPDTDKGDDTF